MVTLLSEITFEFTVLLVAISAAWTADAAFSFALVVAASASVRQVRGTAQAQYTQNWLGTDQTVLPGSSV